MGEVGYDRLKDVTAHDQTKAGVKGLVDSGITKIPRFFHHENTGHLAPSSEAGLLQVPLIDFGSSESGVGYQEMVDRVREAAETWGFFQLVNHRVPLNTMEEMLDGVRRFNEQPSDVRRAFYSRDHDQRVRYYCNGDLLVSKAASWRDSTSFDHHDGILDPEEIPLICRETVTDYMKHMLQLRNKLCRVLSEALGLSQEHLLRMECVDTPNLVCHYYPTCPEPELTLGAKKHTDACFVTFLLQDNMGGLQIFHRNQWVDVLPTTGALVINIGDMMQVNARIISPMYICFHICLRVLHVFVADQMRLITNGKFKSVVHRVLVNKKRPRVSAACFFYPSTRKKNEPYNPLKELVAPDKEPVYKEVSAAEYLTFCISKGFDADDTLRHFMIRR